MNAWLYAAYVGAGLNMTDAVLTMRAIEHGYGNEGNPLLALLIAFSIPLFYLLKIGIVGFFLLLGYKSHKSLARLGIIMGLGAYLVICVYHLFGLLLT